MAASTTALLWPMPDKYALATHKQMTKFAYLAYNRRIAPLRKVPA